MTRINLIPVEELSDQHLLAEYRELPRIVKAVAFGNVKNYDIPPSYRLGKGHVRFFYNKVSFLVERYSKIFNELKYRGFLKKTVFSPATLSWLLKKCNHQEAEKYSFSDNEVRLSRSRIIDKIRQRPCWYTWTLRPRPEYACGLPGNFCL